MENEFTNEMFEATKEDMRAGIYKLLDEANYGDYFLSMVNERDYIVVIIVDFDGSASSIIPHKRYHKTNFNDFTKELNEILFYNYLKNE